MREIRLRIFVLAALCAALLLALGAPSAWACSGRASLQCGEKADITGDNAQASENMVLYATIVEAQPHVRYVRDPTLARFWQFETSAAAVRDTLEYLLTHEGTDGAFESVIGRLALPDPVVRRTHYVNGALAGAIRALERDEQAELTALESAIISLNRAHSAEGDRGRPDWAAFQYGAAARWLLHAAAAARRQVSELRNLSRAFVRRHYLFGIGPKDISLSHKRIRAHGLAPSIKAGINAYQLGPDVLANVQAQIEALSVGSFVLNLSQRLADRTALRAKLAYVAALQHFASRTPDAPQPAS